MSHNAQLKLSSAFFMVIINHKLDLLMSLPVLLLLVLMITAATDDYWLLRSPLYNNLK